MVTGRGAKTAAAEALTDSLEHGGRDIQLDLNVSLLVDAASQLRSALERHTRRVHRVRVGEAVCVGGLDMTSWNILRRDVPTPSPRSAESKPSTSGLFGERHTGTSWKLAHQRIATGGSARNRSTDIQSMFPQIDLNAGARQNNVIV